MIKPSDIPAVLSTLTEQVGRVVQGAEAHVLHTLVAIMSRGHVLLEGPPGTAKTLLSRCLSRCLDMPMQRIQCTPDLMPGDVLGANVFDFGTQTFSLIRGPVFTEFLLADEINRTPPKTQSALLQAMQERAVTIDGTTHSLPPSFTVIATQNPIENEGTYPLPEAQLDRFLFKLEVLYPPADREVAAVMAHQASAAPPELETLGLSPVLGREYLPMLWAVPQQVRLQLEIAQYVVALARATREHRSISVGLSPRASTALAAASRALAACDGRDYVVPDDVKQLLIPLARHRIVLEPDAEMDGVLPEHVIAEVGQTVPAPR